jgi:hypothetical protein
LPQYAVNLMALRDLRARTMLSMLAGIAVTGCFIRGVISVREGRLGLAALLFVICLLLSLSFKEKIAILYIGLISLAVGFSMSAPFDGSGVSLVASIMLWALTVVLARWDTQRRMTSPSQTKGHFERCYACLLLRPITLICASLVLARSPTRKEYVVCSAA